MDARVKVGGAWVQAAEQDLVSTPHPHFDSVDDDMAEWVVPVEWLDARPETEAYWEKGMFASQHSACKAPPGVHPRAFSQAASTSTSRRRVNDCHGNFDFVRQTLPSLHGDCARAESYLSSDPRARRASTAVGWSRRTVGYLYDILSLPTPYRDDLAAKINDAAFKTKVPQGITQGDCDPSRRQYRRPREPADPSRCVARGAARAVQRRRVDVVPSLPCAESGAAAGYNSTRPSQPKPRPVAEEVARLAAGSRSRTRPTPASWRRRTSDWPP